VSAASRRLAAASVMALLLGSGVALAQAAPDGRAWVDAPLGWVLINSVPVEVVGHAADPDLVIEMRLDVDGVTVASTVPEGFGQGLATASFEWTPEASGVHVLEVFGRDTSGEWGVPGRVRVRVELESPTTTTTTPRTTTTIRSTTTTTRASISTTTAPTTTTLPTTTTTERPTTTTTEPVRSTTTTTLPTTTTTERPTTTTTEPVRSTTTTTLGR
jgi:hypothetical protein